MATEETLQAFQQAAHGLQNPVSRVEAEQALLQFRANASLEAVQHVLQHCADDTVRFQALLALRDMLLGRWPALAPEARRGVLNFLLHLATAQLAGADAPPLLRSTAVGAAAVAIKRGWDDASPPEREATLRGIHEHAGRLASLELLAAVVLEFTPATASSLGLSWEVHERCRESLEATYLHGLLLHALACARKAAPAAAAGAAADAELCLAALRLLNAILSWNFSRAGGSGIWRAAEPGRPVADSPHLRPPASWAEALLAPDAWDWLDQLAQATCQPHSARSPLASAVREVAVQLCGLSGDVFGPAEPPASSRAQLGLPPAASPRAAHLQRMLRILLPWVAPPQAALALARRDGGGEVQLLDGCRGLLAAAGVHRAAGFDAAGAGLVEGGLLALLAGLASAVAAAGTACDAPDALAWDGGAADMLLDMWIELLADPGRGDATASDAAAAAAAAVFGSIVDAALARAAAEALEDEEEAEGGEALAGEEWLARVAALGRAAAGAALPQLAAQLGARLAALQQAVQAGGDPSVPLEQLCWLATMCGHVLADDGEGETPLVPVPVAAACEAAAAAGGPDPAAALSQALLSLGGHCLARAGQPDASPRLLEVAVAALARWADTYLMSEETARTPALAACCGAGAPQAAETAQALASLALASLTRYPGEKGLHAAACGRLLAVLARRREVSAALRGAPAWAALFEAVGRGDAGLLQLGGKVQRRLLQALLQAAAGWPEADAAAAATRLLGSSAEQLRQLGGSREAARAALQRADGLHLVTCLCERMRGAVRGTLAPTQPAVFAAVTSAAPALAALLGAAGTQPLAAAPVLKLAGDLVEHHGPYLGPRDAAALCAWALQLLQLYSAQNLGQVSVAASKALAAEELSERAADLRALLRLLSRLTQTGWAELGAEALGGGGGSTVASAAAAAAAAGGGGVDVSQVVFAGLDMLVPLLDLDMLKVPKLCRAYFGLLAHMMEVYPERVASLPPPVAAKLLSTLRFGVGLAGDEEVTQAVFEAAAALARFHVRAVAAGAPGLGAGNSRGGDGLSQLGGLLAATLQRLVAGDAGLAAVDHAAEALLPLALAEPGALQAAGEALLAACAEGGPRASAAAALRALVAAVGAGAALDRPARRAFASALHRLVVDMRGAVRVR